MLKLHFLEFRCFWYYNLLGVLGDRELDGNENEGLVRRNFKFSKWIISFDMINVRLVKKNENGAWEGDRWGKFMGHQSITSKIVFSNLWWSSRSCNNGRNQTTCPWVWLLFSQTCCWWKRCGKKKDTEYVSIICTNC